MKLSPTMTKLVAGIIVGLHAGLVFLTTDKSLPPLWKGLALTALLLLATVNQSVLGAAAPPLARKVTKAPPPLVLIALALALAACNGCTKQQAATAANVAVSVAGDYCQQIGNVPNEPDWVEIACSVEGVAGGIVHVLLPKRAWLAALSKADAGPGK